MNEIEVISKHENLVGCQDRVVETAKGYSPTNSG